MPIIENPSNILTGTLSDFLAPINSWFDTVPSYQGTDFPEGFQVFEQINGVWSAASTLTLLGSMMPKQPFTWGLKQNIVKEYYPGNREPSIQVMGPRDEPVKIQGRLKAKRYSRANPELRKVPMAYQSVIDGLIKRGNLCKFVMGTWVYYGFVESGIFTMKTLADLEYEIDLCIVGDTEPTNAKFADKFNVAPNLDNAALIQAALIMESELLNSPANFPTSIFTTLSTLVSTVASAVSLVTTFVDGIITRGEDATKIANRAIGLIKNAQTACVDFKRRVGQIDAYFDDLEETSLAARDSAQTTAHAKYVYDIQSVTIVPRTTISDAQKEAVNAQAEAGKSIESLLRDLKKKFRAIAVTLPKFRHLVKDGDTLQKLAVKYYSNEQFWEKIYQHNKLQSIVLVPGTVLEIPNL